MEKNGETTKMLLYIGLAIFYIICAFLENFSKTKFNKLFWVLILVLPLFVISAFRAPTVGNDTFNYLNNYMMVSQENFFTATQSRFEIGYVFYMRVTALFGFGYLGFQIITSVFTLYSISRFIYKYSTNIAFSFFIFMTARNFFSAMNISRQYLAIAILLFSIEYIKERKFIKFSLLVLLASSIHFTAIIFLIVYPFSRLKLNARRTIRFIIIGIISGLLFDQIVNLFVTITGRYESYLEGDYFNFEDNIAIYLRLAINALFFSVAYATKYWQYKSLDEGRTIKLQNQTKKLSLSNEEVWYTFSLLTLILSIVGLNATIMSRIESYFSIFFLVFIPSVVKSIRSKELRIIVTLGIIVGLFASFVVVMVFRPYWTIVFPYQFYWNW